MLSGVSGPNIGMRDAGSFHDWRKCSILPENACRLPATAFTMVTWIVRILLLLAGVITSWFATPDSANFSLVQAGVAIVLLAFFVSAAVFLPSLMRLFGGKGLTAANGLTAIVIPT